MKTFLSKLIKHLRAGTLWWLIRSKYLNRFLPAPPGRWNTNSLPDAQKFLILRGQELLHSKPKRNLLVVGDASPHCQEIIRQLAPQAASLRQSDLAAGQAFPPGSPNDYVAVLIIYPDARRITRAAQILLREPGYGDLVTEFAFVPQSDYQSIIGLGQYPFPSFVAPHLVEDPDLLALYRESLTKFERKCDVSDFFDLICAIQSVLDAGVAGDIAEFGSYQGHSGYLIASYLRARQERRQLYMFDMFDRFPVETTGVDQFWNQTHPVNFEAVQAKFTALPQVTLVRGDFTRTFDSSGVKRLAVAFVDCDSYRATKYLVNRIFDEVLVPGGVMIFEDYGHPTLLGNRLAIHECFDRRPDCFKFFSHFSGFFIVVKTAGHHPDHAA